MRTHRLVPIAAIAALLAGTAPVLGQAAPMFGAFTADTNDPIAIDENNIVIEGHGRLLAAQSLGLDKVPVIRLSHLSEAERRAYRLATNDGLWDIFLGCVLLMFAIAPLLSPFMGDFWSSAVFLPLWALVYGAIWLVRRSVIQPRVGTVRFGSARSAALRRFTLVMVVLNVLMLAAGVVVVLTGRLASTWLPPLIFCLAALLFASAAGYFLQYPRLYAYGLLVGAAPLVGEWLYRTQGAAHHGFPITFGAAAAIVIASGAALFVRLLRSNPPLPEGNEEQPA